MNPKRLAFTLILAALLLAACQPASPSALPNGRSVLGVGESVASGDGRLSVTFVALVEDSRCPADAICITSGSVRVLVEVTTGTESMQYKLTLGDMLASDINSILVQGATVTLTEVQPYPLASQPTDPADYKITLDVAKQ